MAYTLHKVCIICGRAYDTPSSNPRKTCSRECAFAARSRINKGVPSGSALDVTGHIYGELQAVRRISGSKWLWRCSCGKEVERELRSVRNSKKVVSCGHVLRQRSALRCSAGVLGSFDGTQISTIESILRGKIRKTNTSGVNGVRVRSGKGGALSYQAHITVRGKTINLGTYATLDEAAAARKRAEEEYFAPILREYYNDGPE